MSTLEKHSSKPFTTAESVMEAEVLGGVIKRLDNAMSLDEKFKLGMTLKKRASSSLAMTRNKRSALGARSVRGSAKPCSPGILASSNMDVTATGFTGIVRIDSSTTMVNRPTTPFNYVPRTNSHLERYSNVKSKVQQEIERNRCSPFQAHKQYLAQQEKEKSLLKPKDPAERV